MNSIFIPTYENRADIDPFIQNQSEKIRVLLEKAVEFMRNTKDPIHGIDHLNRLLKESNGFLNAMGKSLNINRDVLLLALYWHDVWKSQHIPNPRNYLFHQLYEGWGSMFMFRKYAKRIGLSSRITRAVSYAIRKHSAIQLSPAKTPEAQLLWDIDTLDLWNPQRTKALFQNAGWTNLSMFDSYMLYLKTMGFHLNFEWTKNELKRIKPRFFKEMSKFRESLVKESRQLLLQPRVMPTEWNLDNKS